MMKAQELAEAILDSEVYTRMKQQENDVKRDPEAGIALSDMIEKRGLSLQVVDGAGRGIALDRDGNYAKVKKAYDNMIGA